MPLPYSGVCDERTAKQSFTFLAKTPGLLSQPGLGLPFKIDNGYLGVLDGQRFNWLVGRKVASVV